MDRLNEQMNVADDEVNRKMDDLREQLTDSLNIIDGAAKPFRHCVADDRLLIDERGKGRREVVLGSVMEDFEKLTKEKSKRLNELALEHAAVQQRFASLAVAILGKERVRFANSIDGKEYGASVSLRPKGELLKASQEPDTVQYQDMEQVYRDAETGLEDLQKKLDELMLKSLAENKEGLKVRWRIRVLFVVQCKLLIRLVGIPRKSEIKASRYQ